MTNRENILLCIKQWAAANATGALRNDGLVGTVDCDTVTNILAEIDWSRMPAAKVLAIIDFIIAQCDVRSVARMSGVANSERETLRRVLAEMAGDGCNVISIDTVRLDSPMAALKVA